MLKLSATGKMPCKSWSLEAGETCPGSYNRDGTLVDACSACYAKQGAYRWSTVKAPRDYNRQDWKRDDFVSEFVSTLKKEKYFRWFDSGDMYSLELAEKIYSIMKQTPWVKHWLPTRQAKFKKFADVLARMNALPNVAVRFSSDSVMGEYTPGVHGSTIISDDSQITSDISVCNAPEQDGKCLNCRNCWNKNIPVIGYMAHGKAIKKVIMMRKVA